MYQQLNGVPDGTELYRNGDNGHFEVWAHDPSIGGPDRLKSGKRKFAIVQSEEKGRELAALADRLVIDIRNDTVQIGQSKFAEFDRTASANGVGIRSTEKRAEQRENCLARLSNSPQTPQIKAQEEQPEARVKAFITALNSLAAEMPELRFAVSGDSRTILASKTL